MHYQFKLLWDRVDSNDRPDLMPWELDEFLNIAILNFLYSRYSINNPVKLGFETNQNRIDQLAALHIKSPELQPGLVPLNLGNGRYEIALDDLGDNINGQYFRYLFLTKGIIKIKKDNCIKSITLDLVQSDDSKTKYTEPSWKWNRIMGNFGKSTYPTTPIVSDIVGDKMDFTMNLIDAYNTVNEVYNNNRVKSLFLDTTDKKGNSQYEVVEACLSYIKYPNRVFIGGYDHVDKHSSQNTEPIHCDLDEAFHGDIVKLAVELAKGYYGDNESLQYSMNETKKDLIN